MNEDTQYTYTLLTLGRVGIGQSALWVVVEQTSDPTPTGWMPRYRTTGQTEIAGPDAAREVMDRRAAQLATEGHEVVNGSIPILLRRAVKAPVPTA